jgi:hypothetical protein
VNFFKPKKKYLGKTVDYIKLLHKKNNFIIGVHIRHGDYKTWQNGKYYFSFFSVRKILDDYITYNKTKDNKKILFLLCSGEKINKTAFKGLRYITGPETEIGDLFSLAKTNMIIGSNSTYGGFCRLL